MTTAFGQGGYAVRLDWGPVGASRCAADVSVVVDVLSFSTAVTIAVEGGTRVHPCPWQDERARQLAAEHGAVLAVPRREAVPERAVPAGAVRAPSLSPATLLVADLPRRLVLPSPNGSTIAAALADSRSVVLAGCLRNARAVASRLADALRDGRTVAVVAAGERWPDGSLRPALEDHLGAGAVLSALRSLGAADLSPEASAAALLHEAAAGQVARFLRDSVSGRELIHAGFADDVTVAAAPMPPPWSRSSSTGPSPPGGERRAALPSSGTRRGGEPERGGHAAK